MSSDRPHRKAARKAKSSITNIVEIENASTQNGRLIHKSRHTHDIPSNSQTVIRTSSENNDEEMPFTQVVKNRTSRRLSSSPTLSTCNLI